MVITQFRGDHRFLSNFFECEPFCFRGLTFTNVEAFYQSQKCLLYSEQMEFQNLTGSEAKKLGRTVFIRPNWDEIKDSVMLWGLKEKFRQERFKDLLLKTKGIKLVEGNYHGDKYWGVCLKTRKGKNKLGKLLMEVRESLK